THHFFFGDETALGLFSWFKETTLQQGHEYFGVLELQPHNEQALSKLQLLIETVPPSTETPAAHAIQWMEDMHPHCWMAWQKAAFYLAGRALCIREFRNYLKQKNVTSRQIHTASYWADKKTG